ncbi:hypothetical protein A6770_19035 [Nostoc minutum NIES-26]|uniref:HNH endonuclease 5 domain-containing protein n=1 Tax=Nostoc minutum NIES-26 TaxID=1844469 RepID=A0A367RAF0_9NOSO|nr:hypothetical protein A6770_19035 [Nostoc minutum NIES-26]
MKKNKQVKFKGDKEGYCNICGRYSQLTCDHIPPQGCVKPTIVELRTLTQYLSKPSERPTDSQSGLNILSICGNCNNTFLGTEYDPELIEVSKQIASIVRVQQLGLSLPEKIDLSVKPQRLIRSVIGHILAGKLPISGKPPISAPFSDALRNYFLDQSSNLSNNLEVYYWVYPSNKQIVINSLGIGSAMGEGFISGSCLLKFFPLAFWIVWDKPASFPISLTKISKDKFKGLDETCKMVLDLRNIPPLSYPEVPGEGRFIMCCDDSTFLAQPKKPKGFG